MPKKPLFNACSKILTLSSLIYFIGLIPATAHAQASFQLIQKNPDGSQTLLGHMPDEVKSGKAVLKNHASQVMNASIIMPLSNPSQLKSLLQGLYDPNSTTYHQFLTPEQFGLQFGPSSVDAQQVKAYLSQSGITVQSQSPNSFMLKVTGPVSAFEKAFALHINNYQKTDGTMFFAPDADPTIPATLAGKIEAIGGLDNLAKYHPNFHQAPLNTGSIATKGHGNPAVSQAITGSGPGGFLFPQDVKTAYNLNSITSTGSGQTLALFEMDGYSASDITQWEAQLKLPNVPLQNILIDDFSGIPNYSTLFGGAPEVTLDIESLTAFAPGASNILVYEALNSTQGWMDEWYQIASDNKAKIISCSWSNPENDSPSISFDDKIFSQFAAQGQAVFVAAGDSGAYLDGNPPNEPAVQPFATSVGISALSTNSNGTYNSETASIYGGGGVSLYQTIPFYQVTAASKAVAQAIVSTTMRNVPDVVLTADAFTSYAFYINGLWSAYYGSSIAAPIWAAFMSLVNQGLGTNGPLGFANPLLYQIAQSTSYADDFHDITTGSNNYSGTLNGGYPAEVGFDDATGLGSFNGLNLYNNLVDLAAGNTIPSTPVGLKAIGGLAQVILSWSPSAGATSYEIKRATLSGGPYTTIGTPVSYNSYYIDNSVTKGNVYYYVVSAVNAKGQSANSSQVSAAPGFVAPAAPTGLTATAGNAQIILSWNASTGAVSYNIKRASVSGGPYTTIANTSVTTYTDETTSTNYYVVSAVNPAGESPNSSQVSATPVLAAPPTPTGLYILGLNKQVLLLWTPSAGATSYIVQRATASAGPFTTIALSVSSTFVNSYSNPYSASLSISYTDNSVSNGTTYYYVVTAVNSIGKSAPSAQVSATPTAGPLPPTELTATSGSNGIVLTWNTSNGAYGYYVKRATVSGGPYVTLTNDATTTFTDNFFNDPSVSYGITYYYVVSSDNYQGQQGANSAQVSATFKVLPPSMPVGLRAVAGNAQVTLSWNASSGAIVYGIGRSTANGGPYTAIGGSNSTTFTDNNANDHNLNVPTPVNGTTYYYVVEAQNAGGLADSSQVQATPISQPPLSPNNLTAAWGPAGNNFTLNWHESSNGVASYTIWGNPATNGTCPSTSPTTWKNSIPNVTSTSDSWLVGSPGSYCLAVTAYNTNGGSTPSSVLLTTTPAPTGQFTIVNTCTIASGASSCQPSFSWNVLYTVPSGTTVHDTNGVAVNIVGSAPYSTETNYDVTMPLNGISGNVTPLNPGTYTLKLYGYGYNKWNLLQSSPITVACASGIAWNGSVCAPLPPTNLSASWGPMGNDINLTWNTSSAATGYDIYWSPPTATGTCPAYSQAPYLEIQTVSTNKADFQSPLGPGSYCIAVTAFNTGGGSLPSYIYTTTPALTGQMSSVKSCTVASGESGCQPTLSWTTLYTVPSGASGDTSGVTVNLVGSVVPYTTEQYYIFPTTENGTNVQGKALAPGSYTLRLYGYRNGWALLNTQPLTIACASGLTWNGSSCASAEGG